MGLTHPISLCIVFSDRVADTCVACDQGGSCGNSLFYIRRTLPLNKIDRRNCLPQKRGKRRKAERGDDVHHLFDGCRRDRGDNRKEMEIRKRTSPIQDLVFYRQFDEKSNPMSNDWHLKLNSCLANRKKCGILPNLRF